ncbi:response regulator, partial [bacterium]|nr:response regulator [candidate division CSSED10-310 bacterium]
ILAGGIAHDFNNLLTSILGYTDMAVMGLDPKSAIHADLTKIRQLTMKAAELVRNLLLFSRTQPMNFQFVDPNEIIMSVSDMLKRSLGENIQIKTKLEEDIWEVNADRSHIEQVLVNLCVNAKDAMPRGGKLNLTTQNVSLNDKQASKIPDARSGQFVCVQVADTGIGIPDNAVTHIFEPFYSTKKVGEGSGLGLSVVYGIVSQHKGWIAVESKMGKGTTFSIYLPAGIKVDKKEAGRQVEVQEKSGAGHRILVVEDEPDVRKFATKALRQRGYNVFSASNGKEATDIFIREGGNFDLVFCDVVLPDTNGSDLVKNFEEIRSGFEVLLCSGYEKYRSRAATKKQRYDLLPKPYSFIALLQAIEKKLKLQS